MFKQIKKILILKVAALLNFLISLYRKTCPLPPRIYFCYNQSIHHVYHSIFIAIELSNIQDTYEIVVYSTSHKASLIIEKELAQIANKVKFIKIYHPGYNKVDFAINWFVFLCWIRMYKPAAMVVTDYFDNVFRQLGLKTFWVYVGHGGKTHNYGYDEHIKNYDLVIVPGQRVYENMKKRLGNLNNLKIIGYSKLDYFHYHELKSLKLFNNSKPTILYNPHFKKDLSSFFDAGKELLEALSKTDKYNVIFMPHPDLARKYPRQVELFNDLKNVVVINRPQNNLDYMGISDIYITDASSAVLEWLYFDKPVIFFNNKKINWKETEFSSIWNLGMVAEDVSQVVAAIEKLLQQEDEFKQSRKEMFNASFAHNNGRLVSKDIALEIYNNINKEN